jgi:hypothetical protein
VTRFAACFLLVFAELAFGGMLAISIPPFFAVERGFYKSSAAVYLTSALLTVGGLVLLAIRSAGASFPAPGALWTSAGLWTSFCVAAVVYMVTLWTDNGAVRARAYSATIVIGLVAVIGNAIALAPPSLGIAADAPYALTAVFASLVLGLVSAAMLFGHWYLIDPNLPVEYLRTQVRILSLALVGYLVALALALGAIAMLAGGGYGLAARSLFGSNLPLLAMRIGLGPVASIILAWMTWQTLKIPQTMAATGLLYLMVASVLVGEMLGRFIMFRTAIPL